MKEQGFDIYPLFVDYGQRAALQELKSCKAVMASVDILSVQVADLSGYGKLLPSGLTTADKDVFLDAFLPGRNLLLLLVAAAYGYQLQASGIAIGLLDEKTSLFPDQTSKFLAEAESTLKLTLGYEFRILAPLSKLSKREVIQLAQRHGVHGTYSCHVGGEVPCGHCISCREFCCEEE
jgi:7-cyano-7-deazaguanine synthase